jgi:HAD superfamily hydrolase (TIGR01490 family)
MPDGPNRMAETHSPQGKVGDPTAAAFFDVDNTIIRGASIFHLARGLYRRDFLTMRDIVRFSWQQARFLAVGEGLEMVADAQARALAFIAGRSVAEMRAVGEEVFDELLVDKLWPGTLALARMHEDAGQRVWLVTATPVEVARVIADRLGLTGAIGTVTEQVDGRYTGRLVGHPMHGKAKAEAVAELAEREGLALRRCAAYSDSANDIPLLSLVGHPVAVNPDRRLRAHARANGWQVHDYRTTRRAAKIGLPAVAGGVLAGAAAGAFAANRHHAKHTLLDHFPDPALLTPQLRAAALRRLLGPTPPPVPRPRSLRRYF